MKRIYRMTETQILSVVKSKAAHKKGASDNNRGISMDSCPFNEGSVECDSWRTGWLEAEAEKGEPITGKIEPKAVVGETDLEPNNAQEVPKQQSGHLDNDKYRLTTKPEFEYYKATYQNARIEDVVSGDINVTFNIDEEYRSYGISSILIYNISGPSEIDLDIQYYPEGADDSIDTTVTIALDWSNAKHEVAETISYIGIENVNLVLSNASDGTLICAEIIVSVKEL